MRILVFGKDGQLGKALSSLLSSLSFPSQWEIQFAGREQCDLANSTNLTQLLDQVKPNLIINAAAYTAVDKAEDEVDLAFAINARAPELMAQYAAKHGATFLHYSTDYVFDGNKSSPYNEEDFRNPLSVYGASKAKGEENVQEAFKDSASGQFAIFRTSWVYGDGNNFIRTILRLAKERKELKVIVDQLGVPTSAEWLAQLSLDFAFNQNLQLRQFISGIYHAVPAGETSWHGLACYAIQVAENAGISMQVSRDAIRPIPAVEYPLPAPRPQYSRMDTTKLLKTLEQTGDMSKLQHCRCSWDELVKDYVVQLAHDNLI
jgi:dTDP-4-dehydrorhamnose reductase